MKTIDVIAKDYHIEIAEKTRADYVFRNTLSNKVFLFGGKVIEGISASGGNNYLVHLEHGDKVHVPSYHLFETWILSESHK